MQHEFFEVDVFATGPFTGNPLAVIANADGLSTEEMQRIAHWTNFSETTFVLTPEDPAADYRVRIFTPTEEFPFAGHPTLGTARVVAELTGTTGDLVQECGIGHVTVRQQEGRFSFATPPLTRSGSLSEVELAEACAAVGAPVSAVVDSGWVDNGPGWRLLQLADAAAVRALRPSFDADVKVGVVGLETAPSADHAYEVRAFTREYEDPVTGSFNGGAAQFLRERNLVPAEYDAVQGSQLARAGRVHIVDDGARIWVGGRVDIRVRGTVEA
ncbi:PhzF family phenazine biosynthesis protein [uncultured Corynebacterium sp.]|uniref:PhzF family phenazine biosynthesis protein n=1 Tax=uncultured Corynebacterium sp. TaxID=159447 RepID=UPI0025F2A0D9|nr:PhzF family phenazine biosynthesis protein [uncultured Corynebacterium sp.]